MPPNDITRSRKEVVWCVNIVVAEHCLPKDAFYVATKIVVTQKVQRLMLKHRALGMARNSNHSNDFLHYQACLRIKAEQTVLRVGYPTWLSHLKTDVKVGLLKTFKDTILKTDGFNHRFDGIADSRKAEMESGSMTTTMRPMTRTTTPMTTPEEPTTTMRPMTAKPTTTKATTMKPTTMKSTTRKPMTTTPENEQRGEERCEEGGWHRRKHGKHSNMSFVPTPKQKINKWENDHMITWSCIFEVFAALSSSMNLQGITIVCKQKQNDGKDQLQN